MKQIGCEADAELGRCERVDVVLDFRLEIGDVAALGMGFDSRRSGRRWTRRFRGGAVALFSGSAPEARLAEAAAEQLIGFER